MTPELWLSLIGDFAVTVFATIVGAVVALLGARALHERESKDRYEGELDEGIATIVEEASLHRRAASEWRERHSLSSYWLRARNQTVSMPDPPPSLARFHALLNMVALRAKGQDRAVLRAAFSAAELAVPDGHDEKSADRAFRLADTLFGWRAADVKPAVAIALIEEFAARWVAEDDLEEAARRAELEDDDDEPAP